MANRVDIIQPFWKPPGWTSFDVVKKLRGFTGIRKVGHAGSLDPFAEGVLVVCFGLATKRVATLMELEKEYQAQIKLGVTTDTLDPEGEVIDEQDVPGLTLETLQGALSRFIGVILQVPPMYSALKVNGKRLYQLARQGITVQRQAREVRIYDLELTGWQEPDRLDIRVVCGKGTYIRSLAADLAAALGTVGHLLALTRTRVGPYGGDQAIRMDQLESWKFIEA